MHRVEEIMTKSVASCQMHDSLNSAAQLMWEHDCGCVPVIDEMRRVIGIITDRDISMAAYTQGKGLNELTVGSACARDVQTCRKDDNLSRAEEIMSRAQVRRLPVVESDGTLVGILSLSDLAHHLTFVAPGKSNPLGPSYVSTVLEAVSKPRQTRSGAAVSSDARDSGTVFLG